jgi:hypothetical protein
MDRNSMYRSSIRNTSIKLEDTLPSGVTAPRSRPKSAAVMIITGCNLPIKFIALPHFINTLFRNYYIGNAKKHNEQIFGIVEKVTSYIVSSHFE